MKICHLAVVFPANGLPRNTVQACGALWAQSSRMLLPGLGKLYDRFHPAVTPWGVDIPTPFSIVLGRDDPSLFLRLFLRARRLREEAIEFHVGGTLIETGFEKLRAAGDVLICPVTLDGTNKRLEGHILWYVSLDQGVVLPDCGVYYAERKRSTVEPDFEKRIESAPADYALSMVTLECVEDSHGI